MENPAMLQTENLTFFYRDPETPEEKAPIILNDVSMSIEKGSIVAILGHNGSGKSTLAKMFNAILLPEGGKVLVNGMDTADDDLLFEVRQTAGMVFQNPDNQIVGTIVEDDVAFGPENLGVPSEEIRKRVDDALKTVDMYELRDRSPSQLSGGQKQRVAIAGIVAMNPNCIILDEATAMLDPSGRREVMNMVMRLNEEQKITVVMITHFMAEAAMADRVIVLDNGEILMDGTPEIVFSEVEKLHHAGLDVPDATELIYQLQEAGLPIEGQALTTEESVEKIISLFGKEPL